MRAPLSIRGVFCSTLIAGLFSTFAALLLSAQPPPSELTLDIAELQQAHLSKDLKTLTLQIENGYAKWRSRNDLGSLARFMFNACAELSSYDLGDRLAQSRLLHRYAILVLTSALDLPVEDHISFVGFLSQDPPEAEFPTAYQPMPQDEWRKLRYQKAQLWVQAWSRMAALVDPNFDFDDLPFLNVAPPPGAEWPAGVAPEVIKDPKLRAEYIGAIRRNEAKAEKYHLQHWLQQNLGDFSKRAETYLINSYSRPPNSGTELRRLLEHFVSNASMRDQILRAVKLPSSKPDGGG